jgi:hypothetical protein
LEWKYYHHDFLSHFRIRSFQLESMLSIHVANSYHPFITANMRLLLQGMSTRRFVWKNAGKNFIAIGSFVVLKTLKGERGVFRWLGGHSSPANRRFFFSCIVVESVMTKYPMIPTKEIDKAMAMWLKNQKNFERKRMIREGRRAEMEAVDAEDIKSIQEMDLAPYHSQETAFASMPGDHGLHFDLSDEEDAEGKLSVGEQANEDFMEI